MQLDSPLIEQVAVVFPISNDRFLKNGSSYIPVHVPIMTYFFKRLERYLLEPKKQDFTLNICDVETICSLNSV